MKIEVEEILKVLNDLYDSNKEVYLKNRQDYDAGRLDGLKMSIEAIERLKN
jgi:ABC-type Zn uptake system ZnuABC Zn-binding protein ZnuA